MKDKPDLKIDWCTYEAAKYACTHWHYSKSMSVGKLVKIGVWENDIFIGVVLFGYGANPNLYKPYGLEQIECCELTRVALNKHKTEVTKIIKRAIKLLKEKSPLIRLIVSFADLNKGHYGGIYQGGNWIYTGTSGSKYDYIGPDGKRYMDRQVSQSGIVKQFGKITKTFKIKDCVSIEMKSKFRYLMPLDKKMRRQIIKLSKPYPKKENCPKGVIGSTSGFQPEGIGSSPISGLISEESN